MSVIVQFIDNTDRLPEVIARHSHKRPIMIFCCTRNSAIATSKNLAKLWTSTNSTSRLWNGPTKCIEIQNPDLRGTTLPAFLPDSEQSDKFSHGIKRRCFPPCWP